MEQKPLGRGIVAAHPHRWTLKEEDKDGLHSRDGVFYITLQLYEIANQHSVQ